jgi:hypothetical protein
LICAFIFLHFFPFQSNESDDADIGEQQNDDLVSFLIDDPFCSSCYLSFQSELVGLPFLSRGDSEVKHMENEAVVDAEAQVTTLTFLLFPILFSFYHCSF